MKTLPIKDGLSAYAIHNVAKDESGYNYYEYQSKDGSVIIFRENIAGTEYRYANGGINLLTAWINRATLNYQRIDELLGITTQAFEFVIAVADGQSFTLPLTDVYPGHNFTVYWGDSSYNTIGSHSDVNKTHVYTNSGDYHIRIKGICSGFQFTDLTAEQPWEYAPPAIGDYLLIKQVISWGDVHFKKLDFNTCSNLISLPNEVGKLKELVTAANMFTRCNNLISIPDGLFAECSLIESFQDCFGGENTLITTIPHGLFDDCINTKDFHRTFDGLRNLIAIPTDLFKYNTKVTGLGSCFAGCWTITSIPEDLFRYTIEVDSIPNIFYNCRGLASLPQNLFKYITKASWTWAMFANCVSLVSVPEDFFRYMTEAATFYGTFAYCHSLETVPANLFRYNKRVVKIEDFGGFAGCFYDCPKLKFNRNIFYADGEQSTRFLNQDPDFTMCFMRFSFTGVQGEVPDLWNCNYGTEIPTKPYCFYGSGNNSTSISNYNDIPVEWK